MRLILFFSLFVLISCADDQSDIDATLIEDYIMENGLQTEQTSSGLHYFLTEPGTSEKPTISSTVEVCYTGYKLNGSVFDSSYNSNGVCTPIKFPLTGVISGWTEGLQLFGKGGMGTLILPSELAYGSSGAGVSIGPNTVLAFDIHLIDFE